MKYFRDDQFLVEKMLDDETRRELDNAWADLKASFEFQDATFDFVKDKYKLDIDKRVAELTEQDLAAIPAEPQQYARALKADYDEVMAMQEAAEPGHLEDALAFAERAWRRPLTEQEKDSLRGFYVRAGEELELDHRKAMRALLDSHPGRPVLPVSPRRRPTPRAASPSLATTSWPAA